MSRPSRVSEDHPHRIHRVRRQVESGDRGQPDRLKGTLLSKLVALTQRGLSLMTPWFKPIRLAIFISVASISWAVANAGEIDIYRDIMLGGVADRSDPPPSRVLPYGNNPTPEFPPKILVKPRTVEALNSFCVRSCDGRYFPADQQSRAEGCKNLCPASEMKVFSGNSIDSATTREGKPYSALPTRFDIAKNWSRDVRVTAKILSDWRP
jgi:Protein of unknown function (DUF2865)